MIHNLSYCGALIDGEGYIGIRKVNGKNRLELRIQMKDEEPIKYFANTFNIKYITHNYHKNLKYPNYLICVSQNKAIGILKIITPFLICKKNKSLESMEKYLNHR